MTDYKVIGNRLLTAYMKATVNKALTSQTLYYTKAMLQNLCSSFLSFTRDGSKPTAINSKVICDKSNNNGTEHCVIADVYIRGEDNTGFHYRLEYGRCIVTPWKFDENSQT